MLNKQNSGIAASIKSVLRVTDQVELKAVCSDNRLAEASQFFDKAHACTTLPEQQEDQI